VKTSVERVDETTAKLSVTVEADRVRDAIETAARKLAGEVRVPGFRPGKVPRRVLETRLGKDVIVAEAVRDALPEFYGEAARTADLAVVGPPEFDVAVFEEGKDAEFTATVEVRPDIELPDYESLQVPHPDWEVTDEEVDAQLEVLRERFAELETVQRPVRAGDHVLVSVTGSRHGQRVEEASADDVLYEVHDPDQSDSRLDERLVGATTGAILKFNDTLGPDHGDLAGEELSFTAIVKEVKQKQLPALDDEFALTASEFDTVDELRDDIRRQLAREKLAYAMAALRGRVVEAVRDQVDVPVPHALVQQEVRLRLARLTQQAESHGLDLERYLQASGTSTEDLLTRLEQEAHQTVKGQLVVDEVARRAGVEVSREDLGMEIARQAARLGQPPEEVARFMTHEDRIGFLVSDVLRRKAIDHLVDAVQVLSAPADDVVEDLLGAPAVGEDGAGEPSEDAGEAPRDD
jgi:trigger factor